MEFETYCNIKPTSRLQELELIAFANMTGKDILKELKLLSDGLAEEYEKLMEGVEA